MPPWLAWIFLPIFGFLVGVWSARAACRARLRSVFDRSVGGWRVASRRHRATSDELFLAEASICALEQARSELLEDV